MARAWLGLGSNMGRRRARLLEALNRLECLADVSISNRSSLIETEPWGKTDQNRFINMVVEVETTLPPIDLLNSCLKIEKEMGRTRGEKWGPRLIDIDILAYEQQIMQSESLVLPHPCAHERDFVLDPLNEIAPEVGAWIAHIARENAEHDTKSR